MNQFQQFFNQAGPPTSQQFAQQPGQGVPLAPAPPPAGANVDQLTSQLEFSFIDIPELISLSEEEEEQLPPEERQRRRQARQKREAARRQAALQRALAGQGVVGALQGFDPTPYQQHLQQLAQQQQAQQAQQHQQQFSFGQPTPQQQHQQQFGFGGQPTPQQQQQQQFGFGGQPTPQQQQPQFGFGHFPPSAGQ